jgi:hypothetical protein
MSCEVFNESDVAMIAGSKQIFEVNIYNILDNQINAAIVSVEWRMSRYGETECLLSKDSSNKKSVTFNDSGTITITLLSDDTRDMFGKFTHQITITDVSGSVFVADLGKISIKPIIK